GFLIGKARRGEPHQASKAAASRDAGVRCPRCATETHNSIVGHIRPDSEPLLSALFQLVSACQGQAQSLAAAVADFRDPDNLPRVKGADGKPTIQLDFLGGPKMRCFSR